MNTDNVAAHNRSLGHGGEGAPEAGGGPAVPPRQPTPNKRNKLCAGPCEAFQISTPARSTISLASRSTKSCETKSCDARFRPSRRLADWTVEHVACWAAMTALPLEVAAQLRENAISGPVLESLTEEDLIALGIEKFGWRRQLLLLRQELLDELEEGDNTQDDSAVSGVEVIEIHSSKHTPTDSPCNSGRVTPRHSGRISPRPRDTSPPPGERVPQPGLNGAGKLPSGTSSLQSETARRETHQNELRKGATTPRRVRDSHVTMDPTKQKSAQMPIFSQSTFCPPLVPETEQVKALYFVDNSQLRSNAPGLLYSRSSATSDEPEGRTYAQWGTVVSGTPCGDDWIRVGDSLLPMRISGIPVLRRHHVKHYAVNLTTNKVTQAAPPAVPPMRAQSPLSRTAVAKFAPPHSVRNVRSPQHSGGSHTCWPAAGTSPSPAFGTSRGPSPPHQRPPMRPATPVQGLQPNSAPVKSQISGPPRAACWTPVPIGQAVRHCAPRAGSCGPNRK